MIETLLEQCKVQNYNYNVREKYKSVIGHKPQNHKPQLEAATLVTVALMRPRNSAWLSLKKFINERLWLDNNSAHVRSFIASKDMLIPLSV